MEFFAVNNQKRPVRLSESTRQFAWDSLNHVWGLDTMKNMWVQIDGVESLGSIPQLDAYDMAVRKIAEEAPIRICPNEKLSGAATLGGAVTHQIPAMFPDMKAIFSVSHLTVDFETVLKRGINGIQADIDESFKSHTEPDEIRFLESCQNVIDSMKTWHKRYLDALKDRPEYADNYRNLQHVPFEPASNFYEAVQSLWFTFAFIRLCGNWPGIGRIDWLLGDYLKKDLAEGRETIDSAREILAHFFIKGCEWVKGGDCGSGDAQHYQNLVLSGCDADGNDITNEVTYLVLDILEELSISDFPTTVRLNSKTDEKLLRRVAEVLRYGGGTLAFYGEETVLKALTKYGYPADEAWKFANDGCWEVQIPGKTCFGYIPFDGVQILHYTTLKGYNEYVDYPDFETLYMQYIIDLGGTVTHIINQHRACCHLDRDKGEWLWYPAMPATVVSVFEQGCIKKARQYYEGGPIYNIRSPHIGGFADVVNSLYAIKKVVFDDKKLTFKEFMKVLSSNWEGYEDLRRSVMNDYKYYGNDNDEVDMLAARIIEDFARLCDTGEGTCGYRFPAGISTFGRQLAWANARLASPHGHKKGEVLAANCSPTPGSDREGATAIIRSYCKADLTNTVTGAALDIKLLPSSVEGEDGLNAIQALLRGFVALGGYFMQPDVADSAVLREAQEHPENYQTMSVRVSGWNARFVTLNKEWQDMIIDANK